MNAGSVGFLCATGRKSQKHASETETTNTSTILWSWFSAEVDRTDAEGLDGWFSARHETQFSGYRRSP